MSFAAIIFDFDGVVADSEVRANLSLAESLTAAGMPATYDECLRDYYGHNWQETERRIVARYGRALPADFRETHRARARARYMEGFDAVPGVSGFLDTLGPLPRAIASSSRAEYIGWALGLFGLGHHFGEHVYSADGWDRGKPFPDIYLAAARGLGVDPARLPRDRRFADRGAGGDCGGDDRHRLLRCRAHRRPYGAWRNAARRRRSPGCIQLRRD